MSFKIKLVKYLPLPTQWKLELQRSLLSRKYKDELKASKKIKNKEKARELEIDFRFAMDLQEEDEDEFHTKKLLHQARKLRVSIPHRTNEDGEESEFWYQGNYTGGWYLTNIGTTKIRKEIRNEIKSRHEARSMWVIWVTGITGIIGAISGLVAVLSTLK